MSSCLNVLELLNRLSGPSLCNSQYLKQSIQTHPHLDFWRNRKEQDSTPTPLPPPHTHPQSLPGHIGSSQWASGCLPLKRSPESLRTLFYGAQASPALGAWSGQDCSQHLDRGSKPFAGHGLSLLSFGLELIMGCSPCLYLLFFCNRKYILEILTVT